MTVVVISGVFISHWTATKSAPAPGPAPVPAPAAVAVSRQIGTTVAGNGRPVVIRYGGLMIRRCEAVALYAKNTGDATDLRRELHAAADTLGLKLTDLSADVLSPATLERSAPEVVACLPEGADVATAHRLQGVPLGDEDHQIIESVLVHELKFTVQATHSTARLLAASIDREGILSDTLGAYGLEVSDRTRQLVISYMGPLLSDTEIDGVQDAMARQGRTTPAHVSVSPLRTSGPGIDLRTEAAPAPAPDTTEPPHNH